MFQKKGYQIFKINNLKSFNFIHDEVVRLIKKKIKFNGNLNQLHKFIKSKDLNELRMFIFEELNKKLKFKKSYYELSKPFLDKIVGEELVMQKKINLSIQLPNDDTSLLSVHSDTWNGNSPFEVVAWLPLEDVKNSKSMFILPYNSKKNKLLYKKGIFKSNNQIYSKLKKEMKFLKINKKHLLIFSQNCPHGNIVNKSNETRISFNCRFKSLFAPYHEKSFLEYFDPIGIKPATRLGLDYAEPKF